MTEPPPTEGPPAESREGPAEKGDKRDKSRDKVRSAWISFVGRIVAQVIGAAASVVLGLAVADRIGSRREPASTAVQAPAARASGAARASEGRRKVAVLPFQNLSGDPKQEYFADGITEALIADLAQVGGLRVISRTSSMTYKGEGRKSLPVVAQELDVDWIVEGSVARAGERVRVTAQLIDARQDEHLWAKSYDRTLRDVFALQGELAGAIVREVKGSLTPSQQSRLGQRKAIDPVAYDAYLRGRQAWNQRSPEGFALAIRFFEEALRSDPDFALAHAGLSDTYGLMGRADKAKAAAQRALELDDGLAEAHTSLAAMLHRSDGAHQAAEREFKRALELNPSYATAHQWYGVLLAEQGRDAEATRQAEQAVALDPLSPAMRQTLSQVHYFGRRYEEAAGEARKALAMVPHLRLARHVLAYALIAAGKPEDAIAVCEQAPEPVAADLSAALAIARLRTADRARADAIVTDLRGRKPLPAGALARFYAANGDTAAAIEMIELTLEGGPSTYQPVLPDPIFDGIRSQPRFAEAVRRAMRG